MWWTSYEPRERGERVSVTVKIYTPGGIRQLLELRHPFGKI